MNRRRREHAPLAHEDVPEAAVDYLHNIAVPTLLVAGALDYPDVLEAHELLEDEIEDSFAIVIEETAHLPSLERPEEFNPLLLEFLAALQGEGED